MTDPPAAVLATLHELRAKLDAAIPAKQLDRNLLIGTWNLRAFGGLTKKWVSGANDSPKRNFADIRAIAEIVSRFDLVAVQEVRGDLRALRHLLKALGPDWGFILTDVTKGSLGNDERLAFLFDTRRAKPSGLACELVVDIASNVRGVTADTLDRQFARTPYGVSFLACGKTVILVTLHVNYGKRAAERVPELRAIADWLATWAEREEDWNHNLIALGDFNIDRKDDPLYQAFTSTGLTPAPGLEGLPRTIFDQPGAAHFYDQIAWFTAENRPLLDLTCSQADRFDFVPAVRGEQTLTQLSWRISDHYPLWVEFSVREEA